MQMINQTDAKIAALLAPFRSQIDHLDKSIVELLVKRFEIIHEVGVIKAAHNIPATLPDRVSEVITNASEYAAELSNDDDLIKEIYNLIVALSCSLEDDIISAARVLKSIG